MKKDKVSLKKMTYEMYHTFFKEYQNDMDLYLNKDRRIKIIKIGDLEHKQSYW